MAIFNHIEWLLLLLVLALTPFILFATVFRKDSSLNLSDIILSSIICIIVVFGCFSYGVGMKTDDKEIRSGEITGKKRVHDSYKESYSCGTSERPRTCHRTIYRVTWTALTNVGNIEIAKVESGSMSVYARPDPKRYKIIVIGEPAALKFNFTNYVKGSPGSIFHNRMILKQHEPLLVEYPEIIYDHYRAKRMVNLKGANENVKEWSYLLAEKHKTWGYKNKANVLFVFVKDPDFLIGESIKNKWLQGKQNDLIVVFGLGEGKDLLWTEVFGWTENEYLKLQLKDELLALKTVEDKKAVIDLIDTHMPTFKVRNMEKDFEYLKDQIKPSPWWILVVLLLAPVACLIAVIWKKRHIDCHLGYSRFKSGSNSGFSRVRRNRGR